MFDGLLKSRFYTKCKSDIKLTKARIDMIKKKRNAMQKYLRNDVADLLKNGHETNAYSRVEGLLVEMNRSDCYEYIDQCCSVVTNHLMSMNKHRECPEECRESISSLMSAAARIADLPELRELRELFAERYGNSLDCYADKEFEEKLKFGVPSKEKKLQLLQEIALESGLAWNSKALANKQVNEKGFAKAAIDGELKSNKLDTIPSIINQDHLSPAINCLKEEEKLEEKPRKYGPFPPPPPPYTKARPEKTNISPEKDNSKPAPKSVRRRHPIKLREGPNEECKSDKSNEESNKAQAAQAQRILKFFDKGSNDNSNVDDEERAMDKLLRHYSRRKKGVNGTPKLHFERNDYCSKMGPKGREVGPNRLFSLPSEESSPRETSKGDRFRASSFRPEMVCGSSSNENSNHVHPKLPEYDHFVATLAELRGK